MDFRRAILYLADNDIEILTIMSMRELLDALEYFKNALQKASNKQRMSLESLEEMYQVKYQIDAYLDSCVYGLPSIDRYY